MSFYDLGWADARNGYVTKTIASADEAAPCEPLRDPVTLEPFKEGDQLYARPPERTCVTKDTVESLQQYGRTWPVHSQGDTRLPSTRSRLPDDMRIVTSFPAIPRRVYNRLTRAAEAAPDQNCEQDPTDPEDESCWEYCVGDSVMNLQSGNYRMYASIPEPLTFENRQLARLLTTPNVYVRIQAPNYEHVIVTNVDSTSYRDEGPGIRSVIVDIP
jgi:hypothetical protein